MDEINALKTSRRMADSSQDSFEVMERSSTLPASADEVLAWHARPGALETVLPPWERIRVTQHGGGIIDGGRLELSVPIGPCRVRWVGRHRNTIPGRQFVDEQVSGPFRHWSWLHKMIPDGDSRSAAFDRIEWAPPLALLTRGPVRRRVERILRYRHEILINEFAQGMPAQPLTVAVGGATGFLGSHLVHALRAAGHRVLRLVRHHPEPDDIVWQPSRQELDPRRLDGVDAVINLAGETIAARWTSGRKRAILESRVASTTLLARTIAQLDRKPAVLVNASALGWYGDGGDALLTETATAGQGFLAEVCRAWEAGADPARDAGIRVVHPRLGMVLSPAGGSLPLLTLPITLGGGGRLGGGEQWMSWTALDDVLGSLRFAIEHPTLDGPVNISGTPVRNRDFVRTLASVLHRPAAVPVPAWLLRLVTGEMGREVVLASQRADSARLRASGYRLRYGELEPALRHVLGR
jgi:uncharacterized protein (TIGR01777 family)